MPVQLPQEVLEIILENLHFDCQSLRQCALVAHCLLAVAQRILFRTIYLVDVGKGRGGTDTFDKFHRLLEHSPHLAKYTTELTLLLYPPRWDREFSKHPLSHIVPKLHSMKWLSLFLGDMDNPITLHRLSTLLGGRSFPKLRSMVFVFLFLASMEDLFRICEWLAEGGGLKELQFENICVSNPTSSLNMVSNSVGLPRAVHLENLVVTRFQTSKELDVFLGWAVSSGSCLRFGNLRELTVGDFTEQSSEHLLRILDTARASIRRVNFDSDVPCLSSIPFDNFHALRTVSCCLVVHRPSSLNEWCNVLTQTKTLQLDSFIIHVKTHQRSAQEPWQGFADHQWKDLEAVVVNGTRCRQLEIQIYISSTKLDIGVLKGCFPLSHTRGHIAGESWSRSREYS
ncbi:hypothetical protein VNI00_004258 [Paramarasmius palmivorus]|uniref:F-box domain-containing protein n=1 Tax=Paramarasmius palmivorus TaxID=297713 RepID=A0AAW0DNX3_9AGAR